jgi:alkanesulfonate monooxygenase SsuD/methylene tetrahydromethanopterin reductase-like flavin-dependent oxidoreductase (luciferase family)
VKFGIAIPQSFADGEFDPAAFHSYFARAEELGFDSAWALDHVLGMSPEPFLGPIEAMTYAAACTSRIRLGCAVFVSTLYSPVHLAKSISSLDQLSGGRVEVGLASGGPDRAFAAFGITPDRFIARFSEGTELMKALWTQPRVSFDGDFWRVDGATMEPKPVQKPHPPLWLGGAVPAALRRAIRLGDGFFGAGSTPTSAFAEQAAAVRAGGPDFPVAKRIYIAIDRSDAARARRRINDGLVGVYGHLWPSLEAAAVAGTVQDCVRDVQAVIDAGAGLIVFNPLLDLAEHNEIIASEIIPRLVPHSREAS